MKMKKYIQSMMAFAAIVSFASCSSEDNNTTIENESAVKVMTFTATQEGNEASTRAILSGTNIHWESEDEISIFDGTNNNQFTLTDGAGRTFGKFSGKAGQSNSYTAVYPYQPNASLSGNDVTNVTLPAIQYARDNSFDKEAALMIAEGGDGNTLNFKNVVGYVKVKPRFACSKIVLQAARASEYLAGMCTLLYDTNSNKPSIAFTPEQSTSIVTLSGNITANTAYYIAVPAVTLSAGWSISFTDNTGDVYTRTGSKEIEFKRNTIINLGEFSRTDNKLKLTLSKNGEVPADKQVDMGVFTIGDKNYRLIFATSNLTKGGLAENEYDFGDYFAWGATEPWCTQYSRTGTGYNVQVSLTTWGNTKNATVYDWTTVPFRDDNNWSCNQYINNGEKLAMEHDAARQILEGDWQIPTKEIWDKLFESSKYEWTKTKKAEYNGYQVKSKKSETGTIFLPVAGEVNNSWLSGAGTSGFYWSGTANSNKAAYSLYLYLYYKEGNKDISPKYRYYGYSVRPVRLVVESLADPVATTERYDYENDFSWE
ncbi:fimbrillin family protein [Prevotella sp. P3-92]|uniref:fimbrillin family protein n=1 Tax=Prevotella sp. P3-92 TaxID=2024221 RepID=UPI001303125E|nr:fimbrillin family protein [Prevotella sp. P3-92]